MSNTTNQNDFEKYLNNKIENNKNISYEEFKKTKPYNKYNDYNRYRGNNNNLEEFLYTQKLPAYHYIEFKNNKDINEFMIEHNEKLKAKTKTHFSQTERENAEIWYKKAVEKHQLKQEKENMLKIKYGDKYKPPHLRQKEIPAFMQKKQKIVQLGMVIREHGQPFNICNIC